MNSRYLAVVMQILGNERQSRFISTLSGWRGCWGGGGAGAEVSPDREKEKAGFMFGAVIVILCSAAHLVTTL